MKFTIEDKERIAKFSVTKDVSGKFIYIRAFPSGKKVVKIGVDRDGELVIGVDEKTFIEALKGEVA